MSFRDGQRRYGHVPPVQYPVAGHQQQPEDENGLGRRPSFNSGDDTAYYSHPQGRGDARGYGNGEDELFLQNTSRQPAYGSTNSALSGYQHQYQDPTPPTPQHSTYNPQSFAQQQPPSGFQRTQSTTLPYRQPQQQQPSPQYPTHRTSFAPSPTNYTPQAYNPAAYASATSPQRQPTYHGYGSSDPGYGGSAAASHSSPSYGHSPGSTSSSSFQQPAHASNYHTGYSQPSASPSIPGFSPQTPTATYDPAQFAGAQFANGGGAGQQYPQAPYPTTSHMPVGPYGNDRNSVYNRDSRSNSQTSPLASPPMQAQPQASPGLQRHPTNAPLPRRPVDQDSRYDNGRDGYNQDQARLMQDIEAELGAIGPRGSQRSNAMPVNGQYSNRYAEDQDQMRRYNSTATTLAHTASAASRPDVSSSFEDDDDDPEGTAGVLAMQQAELDDRRFSGTTFVYDAPPTRSDPLPPPAEEQDRSSSGSELGGMVDLGMLSGGYAGNLTYGNDVGSPPSQQDSTRPLPSPNYFNAQYDKHDASPNYNGAHMDYGGTGGLQPPTAARLSFDEGDERVSLHSRQSGQESPAKNDYEDLFYHPGLTNRPLPSVPPGTGSDSSSMLSVNTNRGQLQHTYSNSTDSRHYPHENPETFYGTSSPAGLQPERSISLGGHSNTPQVYAPARSRTDAAEERKKANRHHQVVSPAGPTLSEYDSTSGTVGAFDGITLPSGRKRRFIPSKLSTGDFRRCTEPWALSGVERWVRDMADGEVDLKEKTIEEALILLFTFKVPTMNVADAEVLGHTVVTQMLASGTIIPDEEWVKFGGGHISGVFWQLTGAGCYAPKVHDEEISGRCYSYHCTRTIKKVDLDDLDPETKPIDWNVFYGLTKEDLEGKDGREIKRQNNLHEIVTGEEKYIKQLDFFRTIYRDDLRSRNPPLLKPDRQDKFLNAVFGKLESVMSINKDNLLAQLKYRQHEQGPWINGFSDVFREWIRKAKADYIEYASGYPRARYMMEKEAERNVLFKRFLDEKLKHKSSEKLGWAHFLIAPVTRLQRYPLLLAEVEKNSDASSEELINLQKAIAEVKAVAAECDIKVAETNKRVEMMELDRMLVLRPGFQSILNLDHLGRQLIMQGELTRLGSKGVRWVDMHALLFDHYLILAKAVVSRDGRDKKYDVSKEPVPMPLLFLESTNDEPIQRQKGITTTLARTTTASASNTQLSKVATGSSGKPGLDHVSTSSSMNTLTPSGSNDDSRILYPFRVKHLGHEVYILYATSSRDRFEWCNRIIDAKTNHAKALHQQNAEPFRLRVLADAAFHYDGSSIYARTASVPVEGTPLDRAIKDIEGVLGSAQGIAPVCRAQVNCATGFSAFGKSIIAIGTDYGVFISDPSNPRGWTRTIQASRVTQIAVLEEFSVCLIISDRSLISYPLDVVAPVSEFAPPVNDNPRRAPQRLSKDVTYFSTARMKDRTLIFYKRKEGLHTTFKVLEPIYHKATEKRRLFGGRKGAPGSTESFRDFDEFFFPTECYSLSVFQTYIAVATSKGLEMLTLDKKQPMSIPDLKAPAIANIAGRIRDQKPLGMFRLNENEFILTYEDCAVYVDKHGDVSRTLIMEYTGKQKKARGATMYGQYLLLFNEDYVEVRNADNGRLRQIIAGRDVRVLDYGIRGPTGGNAATGQVQEGRNGQLTNVGDASKGTVKIAMCHPELPGRQIVLEMLLNEGHVDAN